MTSAVLSVLFVWRESRAAQPMLPLSLFCYRLFTLTTIVGRLVYDRAGYAGAQMNSRVCNVSGRTHALFTIPETNA